MRRTRELTEQELLDEEAARRARRMAPNVILAPNALGQPYLPGPAVDETGILYPVTRGNLRRGVETRLVAPYYYDPGEDQDWNDPTVNEADLSD